MKLRTIRIIINSLLFLLIAALFYAQVLKAPAYIELSESNRIRIVPIEAPRGLIYDRKDILLVGNRPSFDCTIIPKEIKNKDKTLKQLSRILGVSKKRLKKRLRQRFLNPFRPLVIAGDISKDKAIAIEEQRLNLAGVFIAIRPVRDYIYDEIYSHVVGYVGEIDRRELKRLDRYGYRMNDLIGKAGVEKEYDNYLKGRAGGKQIEVDNKGRQVRLLGSRNPTRGKDVHLTIDLELQKYIYRIFEHQRGACVVMNPENGEVLSLVSKPSFNPRLFANRDRRVEDIFKDKTYPLLNRAINCAYPPGSSFKIVVAAAALEERKVKEEKEFICSGKHKVGGKVFRCWREKGHGAQNVIGGLKNSCNVFFYNTGMLLGPDLISRYAQRFGFGKPSGIDLTGEVAGLVPNKLWKRLKTGERWYGGETANYAIGQGYLLVTPIQVLRMVSAVANKGILIEPHIVKRIESIDVARKSQKNIGLALKTENIIIEGLRRVVEDDSGTGVRARVSGVPAAGKTGTAQTGRGSTHAWFTGFAPVGEPKIALVVFLEEGGKGGLNAAGMAGLIFKKAKELDLL